MISYEEENRRLKFELENNSRASGNTQAAALSFHPLPQLEQEMASIGAAFLAAPVPGVPETPTTGYFLKRSSDNEYIRITGRPDDSRMGKNPASLKSSGSMKLTGDEASSYAVGQKDQSGSYDWLIVRNPNVPQQVSISPVHNLAHDSVVCAVRFDPSATILATGSSRCVNLYDVKSGKKLVSLVDEESNAQAEEDSDMFFRSVAFSPDGSLLAAGSEDAVIRLWDLETRKLLFRLHGHEQDIYSVEFFNGGECLASGSGDKTVRLWDLKSQTCLQTLHAGTPDSSKDSGITSLSISPNGRFLAAGSLDRLIRIWELPKGTPVDIIEGHNDSIYSIAFTQDGKHLISGSLDKSVRLWEFETEDYLKGAVCKQDMVGHKDFVLSVTGSPDGRWLLTGSKDRSVQCWDTATGTVQLMLQGHKNSVIGIAFSPTGDLFATASGDSRARIWSFGPVSESDPASPTTAIPVEPEVSRHHSHQNKQAKLQSEDSDEVEDSEDEDDEPYSEE